MKFLGDTIEKIAVEKCGIIKPNSPVVLYPLNKKSVTDIVKKTASEKNCGFIMPDINSLKIIEENIDFTLFEYKDKIYKIKLAGQHQVYNALTVIETVNRLFVGRDALGAPLTGDCVRNAIYNGIEKTIFPARFELLSNNPLIIFDGAHNISGIIALKETIKNLLPDKKIFLICGMMKGKNAKEALKEICTEDFVCKFTAVPVDSPRSESPEDLCGYVSEYCENAGYNYNLSDAVSEAVGEIKSGGEDFAVVCFGSLYLAGDIKKTVDKMR